MPRRACPVVPYTGFWQLLARDVKGLVEMVQILDALQLSPRQITWSSSKVQDVTSYSTAAKQDQ